MSADHAGIADLEQLAAISQPATIDAIALRRDLGLLTEEDIAALAGVEVTTVRDWRTDRRGPPFTHLGRRPLYRVEAVLKWLRDREEATQE